MTSSTILNAQVAYQLNPKIRLTLEVLNLLDSRVNDITYYYESRLKGESEPRWDYMVHPSEPIQFRGTITVRL